MLFEVFEVGFDRFVFIFEKFEDFCFSVFEGLFDLFGGWGRF